MFISFVIFIFETFGMHPVIFTVSLGFLETFYVHLYLGLAFPYYEQSVRAFSRHPTQPNLELLATK